MEANVLTLTITDHPALHLRLAGKLLNNRNVSLHTVNQTLQESWGRDKQFTTRRFGKNTFIFTFLNEADMIQVLQQQPCSVKNSHMVLQQWRPDRILKELELNTSPFWVQVSGLPSDQCIEPNARRIGEELFAGFIEVDQRSVWEEPMRVRVMVEVEKPLVRGFFSRREGRELSWVRFRYERLGVYCYRCGLLGHMQGGCKFAAAAAAIGEHSRYGPGLEAFIHQEVAVEDGNHRGMAANAEYYRGMVAASEYYRRLLAAAELRRRQEPAVPPEPDIISISTKKRSSSSSSDEMESDATSSQPINKKFKPSADIVYLDPSVVAALLQACFGRRNEGTSGTAPASDGL